MIRKWKRFLLDKMKNQANKYLSLLIVNYPLHAKHSSNQEPILCGDKGNKRLAVAQNGIQELVDSQRNSSLRPWSGMSSKHDARFLIFYYFFSWSIQRKVLIIVCQEMEKAIILMKTKESKRCKLWPKDLCKGKYFEF